MMKSEHLFVLLHHQSLEDETATLRYRDTMNQERIKLKEIPEK